MASILAPLGCDPQAPPGYPGEPLAVITGQVVGSIEEQPVPLRVFLFWLAGRVAWSDYPDQPETIVSVSGEFPARFEMELFHPPPEEAFIHRGEQMDATFAYIVAAPDPQLAAESLTPDDLTSITIGMSLQQYIVYLKPEAGPEHPFADFVGRPLGAGYHVVEAQFIPREIVDAWERCRDDIDSADPDLCSEISCPPDSSAPDRSFLTCGEEAYERACGPRPRSPVVDLGASAEITVILRPDDLEEPPFPDGMTLSVPNPFPDLVEDDAPYLPDHLVDQLCNDDLPG